MKKHIYYFIGLLCICYNNIANAQVFSTTKSISPTNTGDNVKQTSNDTLFQVETSNFDKTNKEPSTEDTKDNKKYNPLDLMTRDTPKKDSSTTETTEEADDEDDENIFVPISEIGKQLSVPPIDGSQPGGQALVMVDKDGKMKKVTNIFLFYDEFKISHAFGNQTTCDVRFNIISTLDRKLSQFDVKLIWPNIATTLSFEDVPPYTQTYYNYTLMGDGCYSMDKFPNITVNRCRAIGMTASECANKIKWLSK